MIRLFKKIIKYVKYNLIDKWNFIYLELNLDGSVFFIPNSQVELVLRIAVHKDVEKIKNDMYGQLTSIEQNDKRYIERIGDKDFFCFIAEKSGVVVHYFLVYADAINSPLKKTPFHSSKILESDAYLGSAFTAPSARGFWIVPLSLSAILVHLRDTLKRKRAYVIVHKDTPGAKEFYVKLGFKVVRNAAGNKFLSLFSKKKAV